MLRKTVQVVAAFFTSIISQSAELVGQSLFDWLREMHWVFLFLSTDWCACGSLATDGFTTSLIFHYVVRRVEQFNTPVVVCFGYM